MDESTGGMSDLDRESAIADAGKHFLAHFQAGDTKAANQALKKQTELILGRSEAQVTRMECERGLA